MDELDTTIIKGYELRERIGEGSFGTVYRAYQRAIDREVAIKIIRADLVNQPEFVRRFETEAHLIARLEHPHIVPLYDYWREPSSACLVMRWLRGGSLRSLLNKRALSLETISRLLDQVAAALAVAHRSGVIHQDVKPENILLDEDHNAYLTDFGIAKNLRGESPIESDSLFGSPPYMAPEIILRKSVTSQADIYSLGIMLYELLTGRLPYTGDSVREIIMNQLGNPVPPLEFTDPELPHELNAVIRRATDEDPDLRYLDAISLAVDFRRLAPYDQVAAGIPTERAQAPGREATPGTLTGTLILDESLKPENPYMGLRPFDEANADNFFGRERLTEHLLKQLTGKDDGKTANFLAVVGPSGSGKSSVVSAGLIPAVREGYLPTYDAWLVMKMLPGRNPFGRLYDALLSIALTARDDLEDALRASDDGLLEALKMALPHSTFGVLLVIDQFEELFTLVPDEAERAQFIRTLVNAVNAPNSHFRVVITLRADFYDRPLLYAGLGDLIRERTEVVLPLSADELTRAVARPAERTGLSVERNLLAAITADLSDQPGALPLLQYALTELFERRQGNRLTLDAYQLSGGIRGALARRADELYEELSPEGQQTARQLFLRLITLGEGTEDTRRRVRWAELTSIGQVAHDTPQVIEDVTNLYGKYRLLTFDRDPQTREPTVEVAHEALIRAWQRLRDWLDESREDLLVHRRLTGATAEWTNAGRDSSYLASGTRLDQFEALRSASSVALNQDELDYVRASLKQRQRINNRRRMFIAALVLISIVALVFAVFALDRERRAVEARDRADAQTRLARSGELAVTALVNLEQLDLASLLAIEALDTADTYEARNSLLTVLELQPHLKQMLHGHTDQVRSLAYSPDGRLIASGGRDNAVILWDAATGQMVGAPPTVHQARVNQVVFSPDGALLASAGEDGNIVLWTLGEHGVTSYQVLEGHTDAVWGLAFSPDGQTLASAGHDGTVWTWDLTLDEPGAQQVGTHEDIVHSVAFSPDGHTLASAGEDGRVILWDMATGESAGTLVENAGWVMDIAFSPGGELIATAELILDDPRTDGIDETDYFVAVRNAATGEAVIPLLHGHNGQIRDVAFNAEGSLLASAATDGTAIVWSLEQGGAPLRRFVSNGVWSAAFSPDSRLLASAGDDGIVRLWSLLPQMPRHIAITEHTGNIYDVVFSPDGRFVASGGEGGSVILWDAATGNKVGEPWIAHGGDVVGVAFTPDGRTLASGSLDRTIVLRDITTGEATGLLRAEHIDAVMCLAISPDGQTIAAGDPGAVITLWNMATGEVTGTLEGHKGRITSLAFSPDGALLASTSTGETENTDLQTVVNPEMILWDAATGGIVRRLEAHEDKITSASFSPDGVLLVSTSRDGTAGVWGVETGQLLVSLSGHSDYVLDAAFAPNSEMLATAGADNVIILWDTQTWQPIGEPLVGHLGDVNSIAFSPDGQTLVSGSSDLLIMLWDSSIEAWRRRACEVTNRDFSPSEWAQFFDTAPYHTTCTE